MVDEDDLAFDGAVRGCPQRIDTVKIDDLPGYAGRTGRTAIAQRSDREFLRKGRDDLGGLGAAGPYRHRERLDVNIGKAHRLQPSKGPVACAGLGLRRGKALADFRGQSFRDVPGVMVIVEGIVPKRCDLGINKDGRRQACDRLLGERGRGRGEEE